MLYTFALNYSFIENILIKLIKNYGKIIIFLYSAEKIK